MALYEEHSSPDDFNRDQIAHDDFEKKEQISIIHGRFTTKKKLRGLEINKENQLDIARGKAQLSMAVFVVDSKTSKKQEAKEQDVKAKKKKKSGYVESLLSHTNINRSVRWYRYSFGF
jgi:hypothetical protein